MKVTREQAAENRARVVDTAGRLFRERGLAGTGVAELMRTAGLTHGGFYGQFGSKDALAVEACGRAMDRSEARWSAAIGESREAPLAALVDRYLSARHRDGPGEGCLYAALAADVAREGSPALRGRFTQGLRGMIDLLARIVPGRTKAARRRQALARMSGLVGALLLARAVDDPELSDDILAAARAAFGGPEPLG